MFRLQGVDLKHFSAYHPQTDGQNWGSESMFGNLSKVHGRKFAQELEYLDISYWILVQDFFPYNY